MVGEGERERGEGESAEGILFEIPFSLGESSVPAPTSGEKLNKHSLCICNS